MQTAEYIDPDNTDSLRETYIVAGPRHKIIEAMEILGLGGRNLKAVHGLNVNWKSPFHAELRHANSEFYVLNENDT